MNSRKIKMLEPRFAFKTAGRELKGSRRPFILKARSIRVRYTPSFFCKLVDDVVYWNSSFLSG